LLRRSTPLLSARNGHSTPYLGERHGQHLGWPNLLARDKLPTGNE
jgi:hypothetical protein